MRSATRSLTGRLGFSYGRAVAFALCLVFAIAPGAARPATSESDSAATLIARNPFVLIARPPSFGEPNACYPGRRDLCTKSSLQDGQPSKWVGSTASWRLVDDLHLHGLSRIALDVGVGRLAPHVCPEFPGRGSRHEAVPEAIA